MRWTSTWVSALVAMGCAKDDPFADDGGDGDSGSTAGDTAADDDDAGPGPGTAPDGDATAEDATAADDAPADSSGPGDDSGPADTGAETGTGDCPPTPTRFIVLGDSIFACTNVGGKDNEQCSAKALHTYLSDKLGPMAYENEAVNGAVTHDIVTDQLPGLSVGSAGHVFVLIFIGGNDLQPFIYQSDEQTEAEYMQIRPELDADWAAIFEFLQDPGNFPDGTTIVMNTQYNPFDDCTAPPWNLSPFKIELLGEYNADLVAKAGSQPNAAIADQHEHYLGHGHHYNVSSCPFYMEGAANWMFDVIHPNVEGHAGLATVLSATSDEVYAGCE
jgi:hypothetical protein